MKELKENPKFFEQEAEALAREKIGNKKLTQEDAIAVAKEILGDGYSVRKGSKTTVTDNGLTISDDVTEKNFIEKLTYVYVKKEEKAFYDYILDKKVEITRLYRKESQKNDKNKEDLLNDVVSEMTEKLDCRKCVKFDNNLDYEVRKEFGKVITYDKFEIEDGIVYVNGGCDPVTFLQDLIETIIKLKKGVMFYERI